MWLLCVSHCSGNEGSRHQAHPQWKRSRSLDQDMAKDKELSELLCSQQWCPQVLGLDLKDQVHAHAHMHTLFTYQWYSCNASSHLLWQQQQLSDISFHYCSTPCLHHRWALDEARSTVNCQAELIGVWWRRREWLGNWNELEWEKRLWEWDNLDTSTMLIWGFL